MKNSSKQESQPAATGGLKRALLIIFTFIVIFFLSGFYSLLSTDVAP